MSPRSSTHNGQIQFTARRQRSGKPWTIELLESRFLLSATPAESQMSGTSHEMPSEVEQLQTVRQYLSQEPTTAYLQEGVSDLRPEAQNLGDRQGTDLDELAQRLAFQQLHHEIRLPFVLADVE